jgi:hypothetical protein
MAGCHGGRGSGADRRDLRRVHQGQGSAAFGVCQQKHALDGGEPETRRIRWEVGVGLRGEVRAPELEDAGLDVEPAVGRVHAQDTGRICPAFAVEPEGMLDGLDAGLHGQQIGHVRASE